MDFNKKMYKLEWQKSFFFYVLQKLDFGFLFDKNKKIVNHYLNKLSGYLSKAGLLKKSLLKIEQRFKQYQYFIS